MLSSFIRPTLIEVVTPHCLECRAMQPDLDAVSAEFTDVDLVVLDAAADPQVAVELGVFGTPTVIAVRNGVEIVRFTGRRTRSELRELLAQLAAGDPITVSRLGSQDRLVWSLGGLGLSAAGVLLGPAWPLIAIGAALAGFALLPRRRGRENR